VNAAEVKQAINGRLLAYVLGNGPPSDAADILAMSDAQLQGYLETKLAAHRAQRGVVLA
jgi:hypothetical protein